MTSAQPLKHSPITRKTSLEPPLMNHHLRGKNCPAPPDRGTLYLSSANRSTTAKLLCALDQGGVRATKCDGGVLAARFSIKTSCIWNRALSHVLTPVEL